MVDEQRIEAALEAEAAHVEAGPDLWTKIRRQTVGADSTPPFARRLRLGMRLEVLAACLLFALLLGAAAARGLHRAKPAGDPPAPAPVEATAESQEAARRLDEARQQVPFPVFVPTEIPEGLRPTVNRPDYGKGPEVEIIYDRGSDLTHQLRVLNGRAGCCLDAVPGKEGQSVRIHDLVMGHFLPNQPEFGGPILWWVEEGAYVAVSGPALTQGDLIRIAASASPTATFDQAQPLRSAETVPEAIIRRLREAPPEVSLTRRDIDWQVPGMAVFCAGAPAQSAGEVPVLACQWGQTGYNSLDEGHALFWLESGMWRTQPFPAQAQQGVSDFLYLRQSGSSLAVTMNTAQGRTRMKEHLALLERTVDGWHHRWGPPAPDAEVRGALVMFEGNGLDRFARFTDLEKGEAAHYREDWERQGDIYTRIGNVELGPNEYAVVRFALALRDANDIELKYWTADTAAIATARNLGIPEALSEGFTTHQQGQRISLEANGKSWLLSLTSTQTGWKVSAIQ